MPSYDYRCTVCEETFEVNRRLGDTADVHCPSCEGAAKRVYTPLGVVFKGSGFHNTDYRKKSGSKADAPKSDAPKSDTSCPSATGGCAGCPAASGE